ncbi:hypothetical protein [Thermomonospora umbrina]|uniref:Uncharacterized protein n=1 Tax=Thermomonospora umbrina TaxID=111806 RepID=A0A3D9SI71_9ACTN|nr:hypothetical protein [Thermomonospora umbrina]REE95596.1 hypothetical protein DFJ69_0993 [Thermomonospora umbrina]
MSGWNPPPGQGGPYGGPPGPGPQPGYGPPAGGPVPPYGQQPPAYPQHAQHPQQPGWGAPGTPPPFPQPPPRRGSGAGVAIVLVGGGLFVLLILVVVVVAVAVGGGPSSISTPSSAGGLSRNYAAESELRSQISQQRSQLQRSAGYRLDSIETAVYGDGSRRYLFLGGTGDVENGDDFVGNFRRAVSSSSSLVNTSVTELSDPGGDGVGVCAEIRSSSGSYSATSALCAWATDKTFGMVVPVPDSSSLSSRPSFTSYDVASTMRLIRDDVEE